MMVMNGANLLEMAQGNVGNLSHSDLFQQRKRREFTPDFKKDQCYWERRKRNNEAAKRSREKRRINDMMLETKVMELTRENDYLKAQLGAVFDRYGIRGDSLINYDVFRAKVDCETRVIKEENEFAASSHKDYDTEDFMDQHEEQGSEAQDRLDDQGYESPGNLTSISANNYSPESMMVNVRGMSSSPFSPMSPTLSTTASSSTSSTEEHPNLFQLPHKMRFKHHSSEALDLSEGSSEAQDQLEGSEGNHAAHFPMGWMGERKSTFDLIPKDSMGRPLVAMKLNNPRLYQ